MPDREHTDPKALEAMWGQSIVEPMRRPRLRWYRRLYIWLKVEVFWAPIEIPSEAGPLLRRIEIHEKAVRGARRLHKLDREEQRAVLIVTAELLGFDRVSVASRCPVREGQRS